MATFSQILNKSRKESLSEKDKGFRFERLMQAYLKTTSIYESSFETFWLWSEFPCKEHQQKTIDKTHEYLRTHERGKLIMACGTGKIFASLKITEKEAVNYRVEKMRFAKKDSKTADKSIIHYNEGITIEGVPAEAYEYVVNGKSAIEWIMERYAITTDSKSGITNAPNDWAREHNDEKYIFNLLLRVINVSMNTVEIVKGLPKLRFEE